MLNFFNFIRASLYAHPFRFQFRPFSASNLQRIGIFYFKIFIQIVGREFFRTGELLVNDDGWK